MQPKTSLKLPQTAKKARKTWVKISLSIDSDYLTLIIQDISYS